MTTMSNAYNAGRGQRGTSDLSLYCSHYRRLIDMTTKQIEIYNKVVDWWESADDPTPRDMATYQLGYIDALMDHEMITYEDMIAIERELHQAWLRKLEEMGIDLSWKK